MRYLESRQLADSISEMPLSLLQPLLKFIIVWGNQKRKISIVFVLISNSNLFVKLDSIFLWEYDLYYKCL